jgi:hypothetical protein
VLTPRRAGALAALAGLPLVLVGCATPQERYCETVREHQQELGEVRAEPGAPALLEALPIFRDLAEDAPDDIRDEWRTVIAAVREFERAVEDAGIDPAEYSAEDVPEGLDADRRRALERASVGLVEPETRLAMGGVEQHSLDVCKTPLSL